MSTAGSTPKAQDKGTLASRAEERFFALDHVGAVRHYEGVGVEEIAGRTRDILKARGAAFEDATEQARGRTVYTNVANLPGSEALTLWLTATQVEGVGVVLDSKVFHQTQESALADEQLSKIMDEIQDEILSRE